jgi:hypothetical protein
MIVSVLQAVACYVASFRRGALLALGGNGSNPIYNVRSLLLLALSQTANTRLVLHRA